MSFRLRLVNDLTAGLMGVSQAFARVHGDASKLRRELNEIKFLVAGGAVAAGAGLFGLNAIAKTLPAAKEYVHQLAQMNIAGMQHAEIQKSIAAAWSTTRGVPTTTASGNLQSIRDLRATLGTTDEAVNFLPTAAKMAYILANTKGGKNVNPETQVAAAGRALDIRNATTDPTRLAREADLMTKAIVGSGGQLTAVDFNTTLRLARSVGKGWNEDFTYRVLPSLMQELKSGNGSGSGGGPAAGLVSASQAIVAGRLTNRSLQEFMRLGLIDPEKVLRTTTGNVKGVSKGGVVGSDLFQSNPYAWAQTILLPAMRSAGINDPKAMRASLEYLFGNRTAAGVMSTLLLENRQIQRDRGMFMSAKGLGSYESLMKNDPVAAEAAARAQWTNTMTVLGLEVLPLVTSATLKFVKGLQELTAWMRRHPALTKTLVLGFAALSASMAFGGTLMLLVGGVKALRLSLAVLGVGKLFTFAKGVSAVGQASLLFPTAGELLMGFAATVGGFVGTLTAALAPLAAFGAAGFSVANGVRYQRIRGNLAGASASDRAWALDYANRNAANYGSQIANKGINAETGRRFQSKWGSEALAISGAAPRAPASSGGAGGVVQIDGRQMGRWFDDRVGQSLGYTAGGARPDSGVALPFKGAPYAR